MDCCHERRARGCRWSSSPGRDGAVGRAVAIEWDEAGRVLPQSWPGTEHAVPSAEEATRSTAPHRLRDGSKLGCLVEVQMSSAGAPVAVREHMAECAFSASANRDCFKPSVLLGKLRPESLI